MVHINRRLKIYFLFQAFSAYSNFILSDLPSQNPWLPFTDSRLMDHQTIRIIMIILFNFFSVLNVSKGRGRIKNCRYDFWRIIESCYEADLSLFCDNDKSTYMNDGDEGVISGSMYIMNCHFSSYYALHCLSCLLVLDNMGIDKMMYCTFLVKIIGQQAEWPYVICIVPVGMLGTRNEWIFIYFYY